MAENTVDCLRSEVAESDASIERLVSDFDKDLKRAQRRRAALVEELRVALDEGHGVYFSTESGSWQPRQKPLTVVVVKDDAALGEASRQLLPCGCAPGSGFHGPACLERVREVEQVAVNAA